MRIKKDPKALLSTATWRKRLSLLVFGLLQQILLMWQILKSFCKLNISTDRKAGASLDDALLTHC